MARNVVEQLKEYFDKTPKEQLEKDWQEIEKFNQIGLSVDEYAEFVESLRQKK